MPKKAKQTREQLKPIPRQPAAPSYKETHEAYLQVLYPKVALIAEQKSLNNAVIIIPGSIATLDPEEIHINM